MFLYQILPTDFINKMVIQNFEYRVLVLFLFLSKKAYEVIRPVHPPICPT